MTRTQWTAAAAALFLAAAALGATPAQNCRSNKNKEAGKYAECRQKAAAKFALAGDAAARSAAFQKCSDKYGVRWPAIEDRAGGACPSRGDQSAIRQYLDTATTDVAAALAGGPLAGQAQPLKTGQTRCWNGSGQQISCAGTGRDGALQKGLDRGYVDNGDGTITDTATGLMWEKLSNDDTIHDKDNLYTWVDAVAVKIAGLNASKFAGYTDWRVPNVNELQSLVEYAGWYSPMVSSAFHWNCTPGCTILTCSCTITQSGAQSGTYWTSTTSHRYPGQTAWMVSFQNGRVTRVAISGSSRHVRAVRGGS